MKSRQHMAIIGSGASAIYLLKHLLDAAAELKGYIGGISIFEKCTLTGMGMPYSPRTTDRYNMSNISSSELPELPDSLADWLRAQDAATLKSLDLDGVEIDEDAIYSRLALGRYLHAQYLKLIQELTLAGIAVQEFPGCRVVDVADMPEDGGAVLRTEQGRQHFFDRVVIATGHYWNESDRPGMGYYASPWPISKLLPELGKHHHFPIGTLGASLSAFDVVSSLAHRHGHFARENGRTVYHPDAGAGEFKITMHSAHGLLPHLQFDQVEPYREIYRHIDRDGLLDLLDDRGFLRLDRFFDEVCRPALLKAFEKDERPELIARLNEPEFGLEAFVETMTGEHEYGNAFEGMREEMKEARESVIQHRPIHWKEVLDDLMYTLNFHAELMPAEDHLTLHSVVMPFLMNVIAAMPLASGETILALYDAGKLDMVSGKAAVADEPSEQGGTRVTVEEADGGGEKREICYGMFIDCSGQKPLELEDYPFPGLVESGAARKARAVFAEVADSRGKPPEETVPREKRDRLFKDGAAWVYPIGGIDIDGAYRLIGRDGKPNPRIHDISFPHTSGVRPYSYGLQSCSHTGGILVGGLLAEFSAGRPVENEIETLTEIYNEA
ncbi:MAG: hypothetical protein JWL81_1027 [Verrucomicrobiales bacterium]|nr:hypothetical protein [Verrucomicrobiales bacterium]